MDRVYWSITWQGHQNRFERSNVYQAVGKVDAASSLPLLRHSPVSYYINRYGSFISSQLTRHPPSLPCPRKCFLCNQNRLFCQHIITHIHIAQHSPCTLFIRAPDIEAFSLPISPHAKISVETHSIRCLKLTHTIHEAGIIYLHFVDFCFGKRREKYHTWMLIMDHIAPEKWWLGD